MWKCCIKKYLLPEEVPSGILVYNLLFLNEFPDVEADKIANRKTMPITMGNDKASIIYSVLTVAVYLWIIAWVIAGVMPVLFSLCLFAAEPYFFGIYDYDKVARIDMRCIGRLGLAHQNRGDFRGQPT